MVNVTFITVGSLKEDYLRAAVGEYTKRLSAFCRPKVKELKEVKLPDSPSGSEIASALSTEGERILASIPPRAYKIALCVEGKQFSSEALAKKIESAVNESGSLCLVIGSSHGLCEEVKAACQMRLSVSELTFPHQMMRVLLLEVLYRSFSILKGTRYHK